MSLLHMKISQCSSSLHKPCFTSRRTADELQHMEIPTTETASTAWGAKFKKVCLSSAVIVSAISCPTDTRALLLVPK